MAKSLQDHFRQRRSSTFIGREQQLELFKQNLSRSIDSEDYYFIFSIHGQGGVGKTTLVSKFQELAKEHRAIVAYANEDIREVPDLLAALAKQLRDQDAPLKKLEDRHRIYLQEKKRLEADPEAPRSTWAFGGKMLARGSKELARNFIPGSGLVLDQFNMDGIGEQIGEWAGFLKKKLTNKDEIELLLNPVEVLTPIFLDSLQEYSNKSKICLFFDTYENTDIYLDEWLRQLLEGKLGNAPENLLITVAGREPLNPNTWSTFADFISTVSLEPFSEIEARNYLERKQVTDAATVDTIIQLSGCLPVLLEVLADKAPNSPDDVNDRCETAVERFLKWIEDPLLRNLALHAALPNLLNEDIVKRLLPEGADVGKYFEWLRSNSFVYKREDHWAYHAHVRELMLRYQRQLSLETWEHLNGHLATYYLQRANFLNLEEAAQWKDSTWRKWMLEYHYHELLKDPKIAIKKAVQAFARMFRLNNNLAISFFKSDNQHSKINGGEKYAAIPWSEIIVRCGQLTNEIECADTIQRGISGWIADKVEPTLEMLAFINNTGWLQDVEDAATFYSWEGHFLNKLGRSREAVVKQKKAMELRPNDITLYWLPIFMYWHYDDDKTYELTELMKKRVELKPDDADAHKKLGVLFYDQEKWSEALDYFQTSAELNPNDSDIYNKIGAIFEQLGNSKRAMIEFEKSIELNPNHEFTHCNLGYMHEKQGNLETAAWHYGRAIEIAPDESIFRKRLSKVLILQNDLSGAVDQLLEAIKIDSFDVDAHYRLGLSFFSQSNYKEAAFHFNKVIDLQPDYEDTYCYLGDSFVLQHMAQDAIPQYKKAVLQRTDDPILWSKLGWANLLVFQLEPAHEAFLKSWTYSGEEYYTSAMNLGHVELLKGNQRKALEWFIKSIQVEKSKKGFFQGMESDYIDLKMEAHGISRSAYDDLLSKLRSIAGIE